MVLSVDSPSNGTTPSTQKPHLLFTATPADGHTLRPLNIARELAKRGFPITFLGGAAYRAKVEAFGGELLPVPEVEGLEDPERLAIPPGMQRIMWDLKHIFLDQMIPRLELVKAALVKIHAQSPSRPIVLLTEMGFLGVNPLSYGAPLPEGLPMRCAPKVINLGVSTYLNSSIDTAPVGTGLPPDSTESGRLRNQLLEQLMTAGPFAPIIASYEDLMRQAGAVRFKTSGSLFDMWYSGHDLTLQLCPPSLEYIRSDQPEHIKFAGTLPVQPLPADLKYPPFWHEVTTPEDPDRRRTIVTVTQGTVATDYSDLVIPTIHALRDVKDLLVVAVLGKKDAVLPTTRTTPLPANTRVVDYLPYDAILPYTSVFVMNAGYGGLCHGLTNGVPMVLAGASEDKPEVAMRAEYAGIGLNLRTGQPTELQIRDAVHDILANPRYKNRAMEIKRENEDMKVIDVVENHVIDRAA